MNFFARRAAAPKRRRNAVLPFDAKPLRFETLENRELLTASPLATPFDVDSSAFSSAVEASDDAETSAPSDLASEFDAFEFQYAVLTDGPVLARGQNGIVESSTLSYCDITDSIYVELWEKALDRWEETFASGLPDVVYQDGTEIDDFYLNFGFSDSYASANSLGSSIDVSFRRDGGTGTAATGSIVFNSLYFVANPSESVQTVFYNTAVHELAHALGYNLATMTDEGLLVSTTETPFGLDDVFATYSNYRYVGENGVAQFEATVSSNFAEYDAQDGFLMETHRATGTFGCHLSSAYGTYYVYLDARDALTYSVSASYEPALTATTLGVLEDLGFDVDYDFADPSHSPAPTDLTADVSGSTVVLSWTKSRADRASATSTKAATYTVERLDASAENAVWETLATGVKKTTYVDSSTTPGRDYKYRVVATNVYSSAEVGVYKASAGDRIDWESDATSFAVYALVGGASNSVVWRKLGTTSEKSWTATSFGSTAPGTGETLYRVVAVGTNVDETEPSRAIAVSIDESGGDYVPPGYSESDWKTLKAFLETTDDQGVKNGKKIAADYSPDRLDALSGVVWSTDETGDKRVVSLEWSNVGLIGTFDATGLARLSTLRVDGNALTGIVVDSPSLTVLNVADNALTALDLTAVPSLESLRVDGDALTALDLTANPALIYLNVERTALTALDLAANERLTQLFVGSENLSEVFLSKSFNGKITLSATDETGEPLDEGAIRWSNRSGAETGIGSAAPVVGGESAFATVECSTSSGETICRNIAFYVGTPIPATPTGWTFFEYDAKTRTLGTLWSERSLVEGFSVQYVVADEAPVDEAVWRFAATTTEPTRTARAVSPTERYWFRVRAVDAFGGETLYSDWSEPATFCAATDLTTSVSIDGDVRVGETSTAVLTPANASVSLRWLRVSVDETSGETVETEIDGATGATYVPTEADFGASLKVVATATCATYVSNPESVSATTATTVRAAVDPARIPAAPTDLTFGEYANGRLQTSWTDAASNEAGYEVLYRIGSGDWKLAATLPSTAEVSTSVGGTISRVATSVYDDRVYSFKVRAFAFDDAGGKIYSEAVEKTFDAAVDVPAQIALSGELKLGVPATAVATPSPFAKAAVFRWFRLEPVASGGSDESNAVVEIPITGATSATYEPTDADVGRRLKVVATFGDQTVSATSESFVVDPASIPAAPTDLTFGEYANDRLATSWTDAASNEAGYEVLYRIGSGDWKLAATLPSTAEVSANVGGTISRVATCVYAKYVYSFKIRAFAFDALGNKIYSDAVEKRFEPTVETTLDAPATLAAFDYDAATRRLTLRWDAVEGADEYEVQYRRSTDGGATWRVDWTLAQRATATERTATGVYPESLYEFRVRARSSEGVSDWTVVSFAADATSSALLDAVFADVANDFEPF